MITRYKDWKEFEFVHREMVDDMLIEFKRELDRDTAWNIPTYNQEMSLYILLEEYKDKLPVLDYYFHKAFRQVDVTDNGLIDSVIWQLLQGANIFWSVFGKFKVERDETFQILVREKSND